MVQASRPLWFFPTPLARGAVGRTQLATKLAPFAAFKAASWLRRSGFCMPCLSSPGKNPCLSSREKKSGRGGPAARAAGRKSGTLPWRWGTRTAPTSAGRLKSSTASAPNSTKARARIPTEFYSKQSRETSPCGKASRLWYERFPRNAFVFIGPASPHTGLPAKQPLRRCRPAGRQHPPLSRGRR